jgi:hypothetical protein
MSRSKSAFAAATIPCGAPLPGHRRSAEGKHTVPKPAGETPMAAEKIGIVELFVGLDPKSQPEDIGAHIMQTLAADPGQRNESALAGISAVARDVSASNRVLAQAH